MYAEKKEGGTGLRTEDGREAESLTWGKKAGAKNQKAQEAERRDLGPSYTLALDDILRNLVRNLNNLFGDIDFKRKTFISCPRHG